MLEATKRQELVFSVCVCGEGANKDPVMKPTFPYWHEYGLQAPRPTTNPQLFELVSRNGKDCLLGTGPPRVDLQHT